jgi:hypothetical protein
VNTPSAVVGQQTGLSARNTATDSVSVFAVAGFAYGFFIRRFWLIARLLVLPIFTAGLVLYVCLSSYISELLLFLGSRSRARQALRSGCWLPESFFRFSATRSRSVR